MRGEDKIKYNEAWAYCRNYINENAIYRIAPYEKPLLGKFGGINRGWQHYTRRALLDTKFAFLTSYMFWSIFEEDYKKIPFQLGACEPCGIPIAINIQNYAFNLGIDINTIILRERRKSYALHNFTEGIIDPNIPVLLVDDLGASQIILKQNCYNLERNGYKVYDKYFVITDKRSIDENIHPGHPAYDSLIPKKEMVSLFTSDDFDLTWKDYVNNNGHEPKFRYNF